MQLLNPKVALFFLAFLPQFIDPARGPIAIQILVLGGIMAVLGLFIDSLYALGGSAVSSWLERRPRGDRGQQYFTAAVYIGLGFAAALSGDTRRQ